MGLALCTAFWPGIAGMSVTPKWAAASVLVPMTLLYASFKGIAWPRAADIALVLTILFMSYAILSLRWTLNVPSGMNTLWYMILVLGAVTVGALAADLRSLFLGAGVGLLASSAIIASEFFGVDFFYNMGFGPWAQPKSGLFFSPNMLAEAAVVISVGLLMSGHWIMGLLSLFPVVVVHNRGSVLALAAVLVVWTWQRSKLIAIGMMVGIAVIAAGLVHGGYKAESMTQRVALWTETAGALTWSGHGPGSFHYEFPRAAKMFDTFRERPDQPHNDALELLFEYGVGALPLFVLAALALFWGTNEAARLVLIAFLVEGLSEFPLRLPTTSIIAAACIGALVAHRRDLRWPEFARRMVLSAGRALYRQPGVVVALHGKGRTARAAYPKSARRISESGNNERVLYRSFDRK